ncbi:MAG: BMP family ABC transporter substrate-binding protein [Anaerolineales bacterium]|nr:BMP family ABC transporter substrate-binding protein [Anaerolineales bacterium]
MRTNLFILAIVTSALTACMQSPDCFNKDVFCAALVTDTLGIDDNGLNQNTWAGLEEAYSNKLADRIEYIESVDARDYEKNIAYFADQGFDMIFTTNPTLRDESLHAADLYPDSVFVGMNQAQKETRPNLISITFPEDQMGFAAGVLAATLTKTGVVGAVCETSGIDSMWRYCEGFRAGAAFANPEIKVIVFYRDDGDSEKLFIDEAWGFESASKAIQRGADVIFAAGAVTGQGALRAASEKGVPSIGVERDQAAVLAESGSSVVTSILGRASFEVQEVMRLLRNGIVSEARSGQLVNVPFHGSFPENFQNGADFLLFSLWNGDLKTNVPPQKP